VRARERGSAAWLPVITVEVDMARREIVQARGKCNQSAMAPAAGPQLREAARQALLWADRERLSVAWALLGWSRTALWDHEPDAG
jgi:hypothetical protein